MNPTSQLGRSSVFVSYAREDAAAARRIAEALRAFGVEVWLDEDELRGGDAWDQRIRREIRDCTLFIALISSTTQSRPEGYFRREWRIAVERTQNMAHGHTFLMPVAIDDTREAQALVPPEFMETQWMRLPGGLPTPSFVERVRALLTEPPTPPSASQVKAPAPKLPSAPKAKWTLPLIVLGLASIIAAGVFIFRGRSSVNPTADRKSLAVLPFANLSTDPQNGYFADGLHDEVITAIANIHNLKVISRTSVMAYRSLEGRNLKSIGHDLGVGAILEGSVQRSGDQVHVNVQLIDAQTDEHLWAETYTRPVSDLFALESAVASEVAGALKATLTVGEKDLLDGSSSHSAEGYDQYLRAHVARLNIPNNTFPEYHRVTALFEKALASDGTNARAHAELAEIYSDMYQRALLDSPSLARREVEEAKFLAPDAPETLVAEGVFDYGCTGDYRSALAKFEAAERLLPNGADLLHRKAGALRRLGRSVEALSAFERSAELDPDSRNVMNGLLQTLYMLRRYPQVLERLDRSSERFHHDYYFLEFRALAEFAITGNRDELRRHLATTSHGDEVISRDETAIKICNALFAGDTAEAVKYADSITYSGITYIPGDWNELIPTELLRAYTAALASDRDKARSLATAALAVYPHETLVWQAHPGFLIGLGPSFAKGFSGDWRGAIEDAKAVVHDAYARDRYRYFTLNLQLAKMLALAGRREEALEKLKEVVSLPTLECSMQTLRLDPAFASIASDPRFEQIIASAPAL